ncbi:MAG: YraN family protein [Candidatus Peribacteraceae bacterium]|nr:YraN family protein [Candidatus Peribacteraceae bacterium]
MCPPFLPLAACASHLRVGRCGEDRAARYLEAIGYVILERNVRLGRDEIDIVAHDPVDDVHVFVEVKTRARVDERFPAAMNASWRKIRKTLRAASAWVARHEYEGGFRVDLICVEEGKITQHFKEMGWGWHDDESS